MYRKLFFSGLIIFKSCLLLFAQDKIYTGDQNLDSMYRLNADLSVLEDVFSLQNPNGIVFFNANPSFPLFYTNYTSIYRNHYSGTTPNIIVTTSGQFNRGLAIDYAAKKIYWANAQDGYIKRANLDGTDIQTVLTGLTQPWDIEVDPVYQKIYWTEDQPGGNIKRANLIDGSDVESVITGVNSLGVAVDPYRNKIYYTTFPDAHVYRANIDGSDVTLIAADGLADVDVDYASGKLFFCNYSLNRLSSCDSNGGHLSSTTVGGVFMDYADQTIPIISSIVRHDPVTTNVVEGSSAIFRVTFSEPVLNVSASDFAFGGASTGAITITHIGEQSVFDITVNALTPGILDLNLAPASDIIDARGNKLSSAIASEETFTVLSELLQNKIYFGHQDTDNIYRVNASDFGSLQTVLSVINPNGIAFFKANPFPLFYASVNTLYRNNTSGSTPGSIITTTGQFNRGMAIEHTSKKIYWSNSEDGYIKRANLDGTNIETVLTGLINPWDIDIDPVHQKIYWTEDQPGGNIKRANLSDGSSIETVIAGVNSLGVAVDPFRNKIYYTTFPAADVYSAYLDGTSQVVIASNGMADIDVDYETGRLYFCNYAPYSLSTCDADGNHLTSVFTTGGVFMDYADVISPSISSIARRNPLTKPVLEGSSATFRISFSEPVLNVSPADFTFGGIPTGAVTVAPVGMNNMEYNITVSGITGLGTLDLNITTVNDIIDVRGNPFSGNVLIEDYFDVVKKSRKRTDEMAIEFFPNPANQYIDISSSETIYGIEIVSTDGTLLKGIEDVDSKRVDISSLKPGTYVLKISTASGVMTKLFIKQ
jgi:sugar lactone lactonase YvrE